MPSRQELFCATFLAVLSGIALAVYWYINPYREAEGYFFEVNRSFYYAMQAAYLLLVVATVLNARYLFNAMVNAGAATVVANIVENAMSVWRTLF